MSEGFCQHHAMGRVSAFLAVVMLAVISTVAHAWPPPEKANLSYELFFDDKFIAGWSLSPDGIGEFREAMPGKAGGSPTSVETRGVVAGKQGYDLISTMVKPAYMFTEGRVSCGEHLTGKAQGTIAWTDSFGKKHVGAFDMGCQTSGSKILVARLSNATQQMKSWSRPPSPK